MRVTLAVALFACALAHVGANRPDNKLPVAPRTADFFDIPATSYRRGQMQYIGVIEPRSGDPRINAKKGIRWYQQKMPRPRRNQPMPFSIRIVKPNDKGVLDYLWKKKQIDWQPNADGTVDIIKAARQPWWQRMF